MEAARYSLEEVAAHCHLGDMWIILDGRVYNVTGWADSHPGGQEILLEQAGKDASKMFHDVYHSDHAKQLLPKYCIGHADVPPPPQPRAPVLAQPAFPQPRLQPAPKITPQVVAKAVPLPPIPVAQPAEQAEGKEVGGEEGKGELKQSVNSLADVLVRLLVPVVDGIVTPSGQVLLEPTASVCERLLYMYGDVNMCLQHVCVESKKYKSELAFQQNLMFSVPFVGPLGYCALPVFVQLREEALIAALKGKDLQQEGVRSEIFYTVCTRMTTRNLPRAAVTKMGTVVAARLLALVISSRLGLNMATAMVNGSIPGIYDFVADGEAQRQWQQWNQIVSLLYRQPPAPPYEQ